MRVQEEKMLKAIESGKNFKGANTEVEHDGKYVFVYLFGHCIYGKNKETGKEFFDSCGYHTYTTKSRLNVLGAGITQKDWAWYTENGHGELIPWKDTHMSDIQ